MNAPGGHKINREQKVFYKCSATSRSDLEKAALEEKLGIHFPLQTTTTIHRCEERVPHVIKLKVLKALFQPIIVSLVGGIFPFCAGNVPVSLE